MKENLNVRTVDEGFRDFYNNFSKVEAENPSLTTNLERIQKTLEETYEMTNFFRFGAYENNTFISGYSDVDYLAVFPKAKLDNDSSKCLNDIKDSMNKCLNTSNLRVSAPGIHLPIKKGGGEICKIIPAYVFDDEDEHMVYAIPNYRNSWMKISPEAQTALLKEKDAALKSRLMPMIRFIKAWKFYCGVGIKSFYLELRIVEATENWTEFNYFEGLRNCFQALVDSKMEPVEDPMGVSGLISPCRPDKSLLDSRGKLTIGFSNISTAFEAYKRKDAKTSFDYLRKLYNKAFPTYVK